jgi:hypothetical protein
MMAKVGRNRYVVMAEVGEINQEQGDNDGESRREQGDNGKSKQAKVGMREQVGENRQAKVRQQ